MNSSDVHIHEVYSLYSLVLILGNYRIAPVCLLFPISGKSIVASGDKHFAAPLSTYSHSMLVSENIVERSRPQTFAPNERKIYSHPGSYSDGLRKETAVRTQQF